MGSQHPDHIDFAGDYNLNGVILQNHAGTGGNLGEGGVNIQSLVQELNIYEGINQTAVYGTLVIVDSIFQTINTWCFRVRTHHRRKRTDWSSFLCL